MKTTRMVSPVLMPVYAFALTIGIGAICLRLPQACTAPLSWIDALFTATSAVCVTGLVVVDTATAFTSIGQSIIMILIQLGGLGIMTYTSLIIYLWRRRVSLKDRLAVGGALLGDPRFHLGKFLTQITIIVLSIELFGFLFLLAGGMNFFDALFHSISAFCNAGFSLHTENLMGFHYNYLIQFIIMLLISLGGIGFYVIVDIYDWIRTKHPLGWQSRVVLLTSLWLILGGGLVLAIAEKSGHQELSWMQAIWDGFFHAVSARTAGFNTVDLSKMTDVSLLFLIILMFIGGSPASCAGGIKTTTARVLWSFAIAQIKGRRQSVVAGFAVDSSTINKTMSLLICSFLLLILAIVTLMILEGGASPHGSARTVFLEIVFEAVSAFGTVGLSVGITPSLGVGSKAVLIALMFVGRIGPMLLITFLQTWQTPEHFAWPEKNLSIG
jgi:trk system potassium uptake protein TrkH